MFDQMNAVTDTFVLISFQLQQVNFFIILRNYYNLGHIWTHQRTYRYIVLH